MTFSDKLIFLMELTHTSNKVLAANINVDPSMISLIRTGRRGKPRNELHLRAMADYFSARCDSLYSRQQIAETLGQFNLRYQSNRVSLSNAIFDWFSDDNFVPPTEMEQFLHSFSQSEETPAGPAAPVKIEISDMVPSVYYGNEGKVQALNDFYQFLLSSPDTGTLYYSADDPAGMYVEDERIWNQFRDWHQTLLNKGYKICQILPPVSSPVFFETILTWLPLYLNDGIEVYFYPRYRDQLFRKSLILVPDHIILDSMSLAAETDTPYTIVTTNPEFLTAGSKLMQDYLGMCQKALVAWTTREGRLSCMQKHLAAEADSIHQFQTLTNFIMPLDAFAREYKDQLPPQAQPFFSLFDENYQKPFEKMLENYIHIDICGVGTLQQIMDGEIRLFVPGMNQDVPLFYTPRFYLSHLEAIIRKLETCENYFFVPTAYNESMNYALLTKKGHSSLLMREGYPFVVLEAIQPGFVEVLDNHLSDLADRAHYSGRGRQRIIQKLKTLAEDIKNQL